MLLLTSIQKLLKAGFRGPRGRDIHWLFFQRLSIHVDSLTSLSNVLFDIFQCFFSAISNLLIILFSLASVVISNVFKWQTDQRESYSTVIKSRVKFWYFICNSGSTGCIYKRFSAFEAALMLLKAMGLVAMPPRTKFNGISILVTERGGRQIKRAASSAFSCLIPPSLLYFYWRASFLVFWHQ